jgi:glucose/arabinose dehydrogenase
MQKKAVRPLTFLGSLVVAFGLTACAEQAQLRVDQGIGPQPMLPPEVHTLIPTVNIAPAKHWPEGVKPTPAAGLAVNALASGLDHPRWLYVLPNGDVLVAETNAPERPEDGKGIRGFAQKLVMKRAGATVPSANRIMLLRDADGDGVAETKTVFLEGLNSPFGMALVGNDLYVANTDALLRFPYQTGATHIEGKGEKVVDMPDGPINHHWTKNVIASKDGKKLYVSIGSNSNVAENGIEAEAGRAAIMEVDIASGKSRSFATGLRNPVGMGWQPQSGALWVSVNERDELGSDLVPDYMTAVKDGGFYGWPYSYYGTHVDSRAQPPRPDLVQQAIVPDYALGPHTASLGLTFYDATLLGKDYAGGAIVGQHGSWNRKPHSGYKVIFVPFANGKPSGQPRDLLTGFLSKDGDAYGRPVGVAVDRKGAVLVADDVGNVVWRVSPAAAENRPK